MSLTHGSTGFHLTFANGYSISVQWGPQHYCDNRYNPYLEPNPGPDPYATHMKQNPTSDTAEVAVLNPDGALILYPDDDAPDTVLPYQTADDIARLIYDVSRL